MPQRLMQALTLTLTLTLALTLIQTLTLTLALTTLVLILHPTLMQNLALCGRVVCMRNMTRICSRGAVQPLYI